MGLLCSTGFQGKLVLRLQINPFDLNIAQHTIFCIKNKNKLEIVKLNELKK